MEGLPGPGVVVSLNDHPALVPSRVNLPSNGNPAFLGTPATFAFGGSSLATVSATVGVGSDPGGTYTFSVCTKRGTAAPVMVTLGNQPLVLAQYYDKSRRHVLVSGVVTAGAIGGAGNAQGGVCVRSPDNALEYDYYGLNGSIVFVE